MEVSNDTRRIERGDEMCCGVAAERERSHHSSSCWLLPSSNDGATEISDTLACGRHDTSARAEDDRSDAGKLGLGVERLEQPDPARLRSITSWRLALDGWQTSARAEDDRSDAGKLGLGVERLEQPDPAVLQLSEEFQKLENDPAVKLVIVKANGKVFCAGGDVIEYYRCLLREGEWALATQIYQKQLALDYLVATYTMPLVFLINGAVMGGGAGLSMNARYRVVTENTVFAMPEAAIGHYPDVGASYFLSSLPGFYGEYLGLTGARLNGAEMVACGLATHFVPSKTMATPLGSLTAMVVALSLLPLVAGIHALVAEPLLPPLGAHEDWRWLSTCTFLFINSDFLKDISLGH
ncbi:hypothetical protein ZIOFF_044215 [Zingiber officinale]|uniref:3-hydroxyisobutyryl-CoA hydrolase n=1 Tax=Zingiber officinale TaxID=94328 RepID=A0A8J5G5W9_ZINOF|nr:hypothetical protein ZIOFF_044215 [Zingiber officinale]